MDNQQVAEKASEWASATTYGGGASAFIFGLNALMITETIVISLNLYRIHLYYKYNPTSSPIFPFTLFL